MIHLMSDTATLAIEQNCLHNRQLSLQSG